MRDGAGTVVLRGCHQMLDDQGSGQRRHQRVAVHIQSVGLERWEAVLLGVLAASVGDDGFHCTAGQRPLADRLQVLAALPDIDCHRDDLSSGSLGDPPDRHRGVQPTGVGQHHPLSHPCSPFGRGREWQTVL
jgi:hypothetical protein